MISLADFRAMRELEQMLPQKLNKNLETEVKRFYPMIDPFLSYVTQLFSPFPSKNCPSIDQSQNTDLSCG